LNQKVEVMISEEHPPMTLEQRHVEDRRFNHQQMDCSLRQLDR
jgi:hypothetical protein